MKVKSALLLGDIHFDAEDKKLLKLAYDIGKSEKIKEVIFMGDILDAYALSSHEKNPEIKTEFKYEIEYTQDQLSRVRKIFPSQKITIVFGNHCFRLYKYMQKNCPELFGFLSMPEMLDLKKFNIKYVPFNSNQGYQVFNSDLIVKHTPYSGGVNHAMGSLKKGVHSIAYAHLHTYAYAVHVTRNKKILRSFCNMCLVDFDNPKFKYVQNFPNWTQGFSFIHVDKNGSWFDEKAMVIDGKLRFRNKIYNI